MEDAIESVVQRVLFNEVSTFFPATISKVKRSPVNPNTVVVDVVSAFLQIDPETNLAKPRAIQSIPLMMVGRTNTFIIRPPTDDKSLIGSWVGLIISNNYLANWKKTGGNVLPTDGRKFYYADAVAVLGLYPDLMAWTSPPKDDTAEIKVMSGTKLEIGSETADIPTLIQDLLTVQNTLIDKLSGSVDNPGTASTGTNSKILTDLATMKTDNEAIAQKLATLIN
jgi:hypothetical protein